MMITIVRFGRALLACALLVPGVAAVARADSCPAPGAPPSVTATGGVNRVSATWTAAADNGTALQGYVAQAVKGTTVGPAQAVTGLTTVVTGVPAGAGWTVRVRAVSSCGNGAAATSAAAGVTVTGAATTYTSTVIASGPVGYYRLGEAGDAPLGADSSAGAHPLTYQQSGDRSRAGVLADDGAAYANGYPSLGVAAPALPEGASARSLEAWVAPAAGAESWVGGWGRTDSDGGFSVSVQHRAVRVDTYSSGITFPAPSPLDDGSWHHVAVTAKGDTVTAYADGLSLGTKTLPRPMDTQNDSGLLVGGRFDNGGFFHGNLDEFAVYAKELTPADVAAHFAASGLGRPGAATRPSIQAGTDNDVVVSWAPPATTPRPPVASYTVNAIATDTGAILGSTVVAGTKTAARVTGIAAGRSIRAMVTPGNAYGSGPAVTASGPAVVEGIAQPYAAQVRALAPRAYYRLGEGTALTVGADSSGLSHPLAYGRHTGGLPGALSTDVDRATGGDGQCCVADTGAPMPDGDSARTVEAWIQPQDARTQFIAGWGVNETNRAFSVGLRDRDLLVNTSGNEYSFHSPKPVADGAWHHVVVAYDGGRLTGWLDGRRLGSRFVDQLDTVRGNAVIGAGVPSYYPWYGGLDEIAVYGTALTDAQVTAHLAASGHGLPVLSGPVTAAAGANTVTVTWPDPVSGDERPGSW